MAHEVDLRPQVELLVHQRQKQVLLEVPRPRDHRLHKCLALAQPRLEQRVEPQLQPRAPLEVMEDHRCDLSRQRELLHLLQRAA